MKTIKILGSGCAKCKLTEKAVNNFLAENKLDFEVVKVDDIMEIMKYNVLSTPAVVVDERVRIYGHVPSNPELEAVLLN